MSTSYERPRGGLEEELIYVTPAPILARLEAPDDRMLGRMEVLGGVPAGRIVAAPDVTALLAQAEVNPAAAGGQTLLAACRRFRVDVSHLGKVRAVW